MIIQDIALYAISSRFGVAVMQNLDGMAGFFQKHFAGTDNLRVVSIILLLLAFILFLFLVVILYIKSLLNFIKAEGDHVAHIHHNDKVYDDLSEERALERELARELEKSQQQQAEDLRKQKVSNDKKKRLAEAENELAKQTKRRKKAQMMQSDMDTPERVNSFGGVLNPFGATPQSQGGNKFAPRNFDWNSRSNAALDEASAGMFLFPSDTKKYSIGDSFGLIINMLGRNVDIAKIAQVIKYKCGDIATEEDVIQSVDVIRNFISLLNNRKFSSVWASGEVPYPDETLYNLAHNEPTYSLQILQYLMNNNIDRIGDVKAIQKRDLNFLEASNYACLFGTLALSNDVQMSTSAYEVAIEFAPKSVNAWSRVGDVYSRNKADSKAIWAYQNVLEMADSEHHSHQIANANKNLAQYYYEQGDVQKASTLYNYSREYYDMLGINRELSSREKEIVNLIEEKQEADLPDTINRLIQVSVQKQRGYV